MSGRVLRRAFWVILVFLSVFHDRCNPVWGGGFDQTHALWGQVLSRYVVEGRVRYADLKKNPGTLHGYLDLLAGVGEDELARFSVGERKAFLINAYNAHVVSLILKHYPVSSIKMIGVKYIGPWKKRFIPLLGKKLSLDEIEHGILRKKLFDPRVHFALVCAAKGCPRLYPTPFKGSLLDTQLDDAGARFMNDREFNRIDMGSKTLYLSEIFRWFEDDFNRAYGSIWDTCLRYMAAASQVPVGIELEVRYTEYDWSLNE